MTADVTEGVEDKLVELSLAIGVLEELVKDDNVVSGRAGACQTAAGYVRRAFDELDEHLMGECSEVATRRTKAMEPSEPTGELTP